MCLVSWSIDQTRTIAIQFLEILVSKTHDSSWAAVGLCLHKNVDFIVVPLNAFLMTLGDPHLSLTSKSRLSPKYSSKVFAIVHDQCRIINHTHFSSNHLCLNCKMLLQKTHRTLQSYKRIWFKDHRCTPLIIVTVLTRLFSKSTLPKQQPCSNWP